MPSRDSNIVKKVEEAGFCAPKLYAGRLAAGSVMASIEDETVFASADHLGLTPQVSQAAFLKNWTSEHRVDNTFDLELLTSGGRASSAVDLGFALRRSGVTHYTIRIGEAHLEAVSDLEIRERLEQGQLSSTADRAIRAGQPVVIEALRVDSIRVTLSSDGEAGVQLSASTLTELFGSDAEFVDERSSGGVPVQVNTPVYIGYKARPLFDPPKPPPAKAVESEPNGDSANANRMACDGSARGSVDGIDDRIDLWVLETEVPGLLTLTAGTTGGGAKARINRVTILEGGRTIAGGSRKPYKLGARVSFGPFSVAPDRRYYVKVEGAPPGRYAEYLIEAEFRGTR